MTVPATGGDGADHLVVRRRDVVGAEIAKIRTHPLTWVVTAVVLVLNTALGVLEATDAVRFTSGHRLVLLADLGGVGLAPVYVFLLVAVLAAGTEYQEGQLRVTLTAVPARTRLYLAKLGALLAVTVPAALVSVVPGRLIGAAFAAPAPDTARTVGGPALLVTVYVAFSVVAFGLTVLLRSTVAPPALLALVPLLIWAGLLHVPEVARFLPHDAALDLLGTPASDATDLDPAVAGAVLLGWCLLATTVGGVALVRRDG